MISVWPSCIRYIADGVLYKPSPTIPCTICGRRLALTSEKSALSVDCYVLRIGFASNHCSFVVAKALLLLHWSHGRQCYVDATAVVDVYPQPLLVVALELSPMMLRRCRQIFFAGGWLLCWNERSLIEGYKPFFSSKVGLLCAVLMWVPTMVEWRRLQWEEINKCYHDWQHKERLDSL